MTIDVRSMAVHSVPPEPLEDSDRQQTEAAWVAGIRAGDQAAFAEAFRAHATPLIRSADRLVRSKAAAQDIVMDVFLRLWSDRLALPENLRLGAYLHRAVRNAALNALARGRVEAAWRERGTAEGWSPAMGAAPLPPHEEFERAEAKETLRRAYIALPLRLRRVIELKWLDGKSYQEIAGELDISAKSVDNYLAKAMRLLREALRTKPQG